MLFNGRNLEGWDTWLGPKSSGYQDPKTATEPAIGLNKDPLGVFTVDQASGVPAIHVSGEVFGAITTHESFDNVQIRVAYKWGTKKWPPREEPRPVSLVHLGPTILDLFHVEAPGGMDGESLLELARDGGTTPPLAPIVAANNDDMTAFLDPDGRYKLIFDRRGAFVELYDLDADPRERRNLADERRDVLLRLQGAYRLWRRHYTGR